MVSRDLIRRICSFGIIGAGATLLYAVVALTMVRAGGFSAALASLAGCVASACWSYGLNKVVTFRSRDRHRVAVPKFAVTVVIAFGVSMLIPFVMTDLLAWRMEWSILLAVVVVPPLNFLMLNGFVFAGAKNGKLARSAQQA